MWPPVRSSSSQYAAGRPGSSDSSTRRPHTCSNGTLPDEILDVDAAVAELAAFVVRLGDLRLERDDAGEAWAELVHAWISSNSISKPTSRSRAAANTSAAAARSWTATPTDLYSVISTGVARPRLTAAHELSELRDGGRIDARELRRRRRAAARTTTRATRRRSSQSARAAGSSSEPGAL